jgi:LacI family transcriptional regulator
MKVTLKDIAEKTNVSISTVSRVLNNQPTSLDDETINNILEVSKVLGYKKTKNIQKKEEKFSEIKFGCVLNNIKNKYYDPYFSEIIYGIERELLDHGHILNFTYDTQELIQSNYSFEDEGKNLALISVGPIDKDILQTLSHKVSFFISAGGNPLLDIDYVTIDFVKASLKAVTHLVDKGHKDIAYIGGSSYESNIPFEQEERFVGYKKALKSHGLHIVSEWVQDGKFDLNEGYLAMKRILACSKKPTAVFIASDRMAYGAYKAIQEAGLTIPKDIAVVAFDDLEMSKFVTPPLTTVRVHKEELGRLTVKMLIQRMDNNINLPLTTYLPTELIIRKSCG